jgi:hypothetical protein
VAETYNEAIDSYGFDCDVANCCTKLADVGDTVREKPTKLTSLAAVRVLALGCLAVVPLTGCSQTTSSEASNWMAPSSRSDLATIQTETSSVALITALSELEPEGRRFAFAADVDVMQPVRRADPALAADEQITAVLAQVGLAARQDGETIHVERVVAENTAAPVELAPVPPVATASNEEAMPASEGSAAIVVAQQEPDAQPEQVVPAAVVLADATVKGTPVHHPRDQKSAEAKVAAREPEAEIATLIARDEAAGASKALANRTLMSTPVLRKGDQALAVASGKESLGRTPLTSRREQAAARLANRTLMSGPIISAGDQRPAPVALASAKTEPANIEDLIAQSSQAVEAETKIAKISTPAPEPVQAQAQVEAMPVAVAKAPDTAAPQPAQAEQAVTVAAPVAEPVAEVVPEPIILTETAPAAETVAEIVPEPVIAERAAPVRKSWGRKAVAAMTSSDASTEPAPIAMPEQVAETQEALPQTVAELIEANPAAAAPSLQLMRIPAQKPLQIQTAQTVVELAPVEVQPQAAPAAEAEQTETMARRKSWSRKKDAAELATAPLALTTPEMVAEAPQVSEEPVEELAVQSSAVTLSPEPVEVAKPVAPAPQMAAVKMAVPPVKPNPIIQAAVVIPEVDAISDQVVTAVQSANAEAGLDTAMGVDTHPERRTFKASKAVKLPDVWSAKRGQTLRATLSDWCDRQGVQLIWRTEYDYPLAADIALEGNFETAVRNILLGFAAAAPQPVGRLHRQGTAGSAVLIISSRGNDYGDN